MHTYNNQACTKPGLNKSHHVQAYTGNYCPPQLLGENLQNLPARIDLDNTMTGIRPTSRIHVGRVYTVQHNLRFCSVGRVRDEDFKRLLGLIALYINPLETN